MSRNSTVASTRKIRYVTALLAIAVTVVYFTFPKMAISKLGRDPKTNNSIKNTANPSVDFLNNRPESMILVQESAVLAQSGYQTVASSRKKERISTNQSKDRNAKPVAKKIVIVTAYSSTVDQTDSTPFITASGIVVHDGVVAANFLKFGTKVRFPSLYGEKVFVVADRMKSNHKVDIWFPTREEAKAFGVKRVEMEIL